MYYNYYQNQAVMDYTWLIISGVIAFLGGIIVYLLFISKNNKGKYKGFLAWLHDFLNFKTFFVETLLKILYAMCAIFVTLGSFSFIRTSIGAFFGILIFGNLAVRIIFELILMMITIASNVSEINNKLDIKKDKPIKKAINKEDKPKKKE